MNDIEQCTKKSIHNRAAVEAADLCGCYFCLRVYPAKEVTEWADGADTALCPNCDIDAVLPGVSDAEFLAAACERWFCGSGQA